MLSKRKVEQENKSKKRRDERKREKERILPDKKSYTPNGGSDEVATKEVSGAVCGKQKKRKTTGCVWALVKDWKGGGVLDGLTRPRGPR